jgi:hypothetical protein
VVGVHAVGAAAVGDDLGAVGHVGEELVEVLVFEIVDGDGPGAGDVARPVLRRGADVDDDTSPASIRRTSSSRSPARVRAVAEVGGGELVEMRVVRGGDVAQRRPEFADPS